MLYIFCCRSYEVQIFSSNEVASAPTAGSVSIRCTLDMETTSESERDTSVAVTAEAESDFDLLNSNVTMSDVTSDSTTNTDLTFTEMNASENATKLLDKITTVVYDSAGLTQGEMSSVTVSDAYVPTTETPIAKAKFSNMEIWFIATGSVILAVIVLFCINTCIQCKVCEKVFKCFKRRNQMADIERRSHRDFEASYGAQDDSKSTTTHMFLNRMFFRRKQQQSPQQA